MKLFTIILFTFATATQAFAPVSTAFRSTCRTSPAQPVVENVPAALTHQRRSVANVQTCGLFGLGVPELAVIAIAAAFLLGPQKLAELGKDAGKIAGELKDVPKEFQKGLEEGEAQAKAMKSSDDSVADAEVKESK